MERRRHDHNANFAIPGAVPGAQEICLEAGNWAREAQHLIRRRHLRRRRYLPQARFRILNGIGHLSPLEAPDALADICGAVLESR